MKARQTQTRLLIGRKGSGKSYLGKQIANDYRGPVLVWDSVEEWRNERSLNRAAYYDSLPLYLKGAKNGDRQPKRLVLGTSRHHWEAFCRFAYRTMKLRKGGLVVIEELSRWTDSNSKIEGWLDLMERSRHAGIDLLCICPRVMDVPIKLRSQADVWSVFKTSDPSLLKDIRSRFGDKAVRDVQALGKHQHIDFHQ